MMRDEHELFPVTDQVLFDMFNHRCVSCKAYAVEINEIIPRSRSINSIADWRNRVPMCRDCHSAYHHNGVTDDKIKALQDARKKFLISLGRIEFV